jgi:hypothetical protein
MADAEAICEAVDANVFQVTMKTRHNKGDHLMNKARLLCILALPFTAQPALAQVPGPFPLQLPSASTNYKGMTKDDLWQFCIFNDAIFSLGTTICSAKGTASTCEGGNEKRAQWKTSPATQCGDPLAR